MRKNYTQITLAQAEGLDRLAVYLWRTRDQPRAVVQILHGVREHMARYSEFASYLTARGYAVCGHDHMGHGRSGTSESAFGYFGETGGPKKLVKDSYRVTRLIQREYPEIPIFLLGHSMGSLIGRLYILHYSSEIAGFVCMATSDENRFAPVARAFSELVIKAKGTKAEARLLDKLTFWGYNKRFTLENSRMAWLSRDPQTVEDYEWDALIRPYITNSGFRDLYELEIAACGKQWAGKVDKSLPIMLVSGAEDPMGDHGKGVVRVYEKLKLAGALDVQCKLYEGARHELLNEINREEVYHDIHTWMEDHLH